MDKKYLHHLWKRLRGLKPWYFLVLALVSGAICIAALRHNNEHMARLRDAVYAADKDNGDVQGALQNLQAYVTAHMNTSLEVPNGVYPPIQLKYTYDRLVQAESDQAAQANSQNSQIYTDAQTYCEAKIPNGFSGSYRIACIQDYVTSHGIGDAVALKPIPDSLYKFDFASPRWSPDLAGWSMVVAGISGVAFVVLWALERWLKRAGR
jgi:hypothetical protein